MANTFTWPLTLGDTTQVIYNGIQFGTARRTKWSAALVYSDSRRVTKYTRYTIEIEGYVNGGTNAPADSETLMTNILTALTAPGKDLFISGLGFGTLKVGPRGTPDAEFGPHPEVLEWRNCGGALTSFVKFRITCAIPTHCADVKTAGAFCMVEFDQSFIIDAKGYTTVRTSIVAEIPMSRTRDNTVPDTIDAYTEKLAPARIPGFRREYPERKISKDHRRIDLTVLDVEMAYALPPGTAAMKFSHRVRGAMRQGAYRAWQGELKATVTLPAGVAPGLARSKFYLLLTDRLSFAAGPGGGAPNQPLPAIGAPALAKANANAKMVMITDVDLSEDEVFEFSQSTFIVKYTMFGSSLQNILADSGLWRPPGTDFQLWKISAFNPRGAAGLKQLPSQDALIDLCNYTAPPPARTPPLVPQLARGASGAVSAAVGGKVMGSPDGAGSGAAAGGVSPGPGFSDRGNPVKPEASWLHYEVAVDYEEDDRIARSKPLAGVASTDESVGPDATDTALHVARDVSDLALGAKANMPDLFQRVSSPTARVRLTGRAIRAGYPINPPRLVSVGGVPAVRSHQRLRTVPASSLGGYVLYALGWSITYELALPPDTLPIPANPMLNVSGDADGLSGLIGK